MMSCGCHKGFCWSLFVLVNSVQALATWTQVLRLRRLRTVTDKTTLTSICVRRHHVLLYLKSESEPKFSLTTHTLNEISPIISVSVGIRVLPTGVTYKRCATHYVAQSLQERCDKDSRSVLDCRRARATENGRISNYLTLSKRPPLSLANGCGISATLHRSIVEERERGSGVMATWKNATVAQMAAVQGSLTKLTVEKKP